MRRALIVLLILCLPVLAGCYDAIDLNEQIFAVNLALDKGKDTALKLTLQMPQIVPTGKEPAQTDSDLQKNGYVLQQTEGDTLQECLQLMHMLTPRQLSLMQLRGVYISEDLAKDNVLLKSCLAVLADAHTVRPAALAYVTRGRAEDVLRAQLPLFGARLSKAQAAQSNALRQQGIIPLSPLKHFTADLNSASGCASAALVAINRPDAAASAGASPSTAYLAGELPRSTADTVDFCGSALIGEDGLLLLDGYETQLLNLLRGDLRCIHRTSEGTTVHIELQRRPHIRVRIADMQPHIEIRMSVRTDSAESTRYTEVLYEDMMTLLLKLQQHGADPVGFADRARMHTLTLAQWEETDWHNAYRCAVWEIKGTLP